MSLKILEGSTWTSRSQYLFETSSSSSRTIACPRPSLIKVFTKLSEPRRRLLLFRRVSWRPQSYQGKGRIAYEASTTFERYSIIKRHEPPVRSRSFPRSNLSCLLSWLLSAIHTLFLYFSCLRLANILPVSGNSIDPSILRSFHPLSRGLTLPLFDVLKKLTRFSLSRLKP